MTRNGEIRHQLKRSSHRSAGQGRSFLDMLENLRNQRGLIDAGDYPEFFAALEALRPIACSADSRSVEWPRTPNLPA